MRKKRTEKVTREKYRLFLLVNYLTRLLKEIFLYNNIENVYLNSIYFLFTLIEQRQREKEKEIDCYTKTREYKYYKSSDPELRRRREKNLLHDAIVLPFKTQPDEIIPIANIHVYLIINNS